MLTQLLQINAQDDDEAQSPITPASLRTPSSPPPSFHSRASSPTTRNLLRQDPLSSEGDQTLADTFDDGEASDAENDGDDRQRLMRGGPAPTSTPQSNETPTTPPIERTVTELPAFRPQSQARNMNRPTNDGVFANLAAKPGVGETSDEKPPVSLRPLCLYMPLANYAPVLRSRRR